MHTNRSTAMADPNLAGTLDPDDWEELRVLGHRMVDDMVERHRTVRDGPVWRPIPDDIAESFRGPVPRTGLGAEAAFEEVQKRVLPFPLGNTHPRFWGWVLGTGTPLGALAELVAAGYNANMPGLRNAGVFLEHQTMEWLRELLGFDADASGLLVSGGSMANNLGIAIGIQARAEHDVGRDGLATAPRPPVIYASRETHYSVHKAVRMLGLGDRGLRLMPVDEEFRVNLIALENAIAADRADGRHPLAVVGNAGTVNTGAFDDLDALADLVAREDMWLHVDGAFGAFAAWDETVAHLADGMSRADSVAFDLHKWMCVPFECGGLFVRDPVAHRDAFTVPADYLTPLTRGVGQKAGEFADLGPQLTRSFRALKVWMSLYAHGADAFADVVRDNVAQARHLVGLVTARDELELMAPAPLNVVCFRYDPGGLGPAALDALNLELLLRIQESGVAVASSTALRGAFVLRCAITNHRTRREDLDLFIDEVLRLGERLAAESSWSDSGVADPAAAPGPA